MAAPDRTASMLAIIILILTVTFAVSPFLSDGFAGFDASQFPVPVEDPPSQPAGYAFAIWGVIYLYLIGMAAFGVLKRRHDAGWQATRVPLAVSLGVGTFWIAVANASPVWATVMIWVMLAGAIVALLRSPAQDAWLLRGSLGLYAGWLTAASAVSLGILGTGYGVQPLDPDGWAVVALGVALAVGLATILLLPAPTYAAALVWALVAVTVANGFGLVGGTALAGAVAVAAIAAWGRFA